MSFRLLRGPVPHVIETFTFAEPADGTRLTYTGGARHRPLAAGPGLGSPGRRQLGAGGPGLPGRGQDRERTARGGVVAPGTEDSFDAMCRLTGVSSSPEVGCPESEAPKVVAVDLSVRS